MAIDILNPEEIISALFGNMYFFGAIVILGFLYVAAKYRFNLQLTVIGFVTIFLLTTIIIIDFHVWISFIVVGLISLLTYTFLRIIASK